MLTIGQVAVRAGLRPSAIRYYEAQGLLPAASRRGGKRMYQESILERLGVIAVAKVAGFDLSEIRGVLSRIGAGQPASTWRTVARTKQIEIDGQMRRLARMKDILTSLAGCGCATLEECGRAFLDARSQQPPHPAVEPLEQTKRRRLSAKTLTRRG